MSDVRVVLQGWKNRRSDCAELALCIEDLQTGLVEEVPFPADSAEAQLDLAPGRYRITARFVSSGRGWRVASEVVEVPHPFLIVLDLDDATADEWP